MNKKRTWLRRESRRKLRDFLEQVGRKGINDEEVFITTEKLAVMLDVCRLTVWKWIRSGELKAYRINWEWRITPADLEAFLQSKKGNTRRQHLSKQDLSNWT